MAPFGSQNPLAVVSQKSFTKSRTRTLRAVAMSNRLTMESFGCTLDPRNIGPVEVCPFGKLFLREPSLEPLLPYRKAEHSSDRRLSQPHPHLPALPGSRQPPGHPASLATKAACTCEPPQPSLTPPGAELKLGCRLEMAPAVKSNAKNGVVTQPLPAGAPRLHAAQPLSQGSSPVRSSLPPRGSK